MQEKLGTIGEFGVNHVSYCAEKIDQVYEEEVPGIFKPGERNVLLFENVERFNRQAALRWRDEFVRLGSAMSAELYVEKQLAGEKPPTHNDQISTVIRMVTGRPGLASTYGGRPYFQIDYLASIRPDLAIVAMPESAIRDESIKTHDSEVEGSDKEHGRIVNLQELVRHKTHYLASELEKQLHSRDREVRKFLMDEYIREAIRKGTKLNIAIIFGREHKFFTNGSVDESVTVNFEVIRKNCGTDHEFDDISFLLDSSKSDQERERFASFELVEVCLKESIMRLHGDKKWITFEGETVFKRFYDFWKEVPMAVIYKILQGYWKFDCGVDPTVYADVEVPPLLANLRNRGRTDAFVKSKLCGVREIGDTGVEKYMRRQLVEKYLLMGFGVKNEPLVVRSMKDLVDFLADDYVGRVAREIDNLMLTKSAMYTTPYTEYLLECLQKTNVQGDPLHGFPTDKMAVLKKRLRGVRFQYFAF